MHDVLIRSRLLYAACHARLSQGHSESFPSSFQYTISCSRPPCWGNWRSRQMHLVISFYFPGLCLRTQLLSTGKLYPTFKHYCLLVPTLVPPSTVKQGTERQATESCKNLSPRLSTVSTKLCLLTGTRMQHFPKSRLRPGLSSGSFHDLQGKEMPRRRRRYFPALLFKT